MSWIAIVLWVLRYAPDVIGLIKQIIDLLHTLPKDQQAKALQELTAAKGTHQPEAVREVAQKWRDRCSLSGGVGCGGDLI